MLEAVGLQAAKRRAGPARGTSLGRRQRRDPPLDQLAQRLFQPRRELLERRVFVVRREKNPAIGEVPPPERIERIELGDALGARLRITRIDRGGAGVAEREQVGRAMRSRTAQRVLILPLGACHRGAAVDAAILAQGRLLGQRRAEPRPQDEDDDIALARRRERVLEMPGRDQRLVLPADHLEAHVPAEFLGKLVDDEPGAQPLVRHVAGR